ncbi:MAG: hypothetical protein L0Y38_05405 [Methylococcaceae bacterium]|nr:hypothetical protein [Methylococcaceae bacterium]MCI0733242.1 hypothetical protein [Methylococcaceae bacterium]
MKRISVIFLGLLGLASCDFGGSPDYEYQTIVGNSPYSDWKNSRNQAMAAAQAEFGAFAKSECRRAISNGWSLSRVREEGEMNCEQTKEGIHCRKKKVELECRQVGEFFP